MADFQTERRNVGNGWQPIIERLHESLQRLFGSYEIHQIKEKFGGLRYYAGFPDLASPEDTTEAYRLIDEAESKSLETCEDCGNRGQAHDINGWYRTVCNYCLGAKV